MRGGQLRRRASGDRALKGPTPHAPSSCQLSFLPPFALFSSLFSPSLDFFLGLRLSALTSRTSFSRFSSAFLRTFALSPVTFHPSPPSFTFLGCCTMSLVNYTGFLERFRVAFGAFFVGSFFRLPFRLFPPPTILLSLPPPLPLFPPTGRLVSSRSALAFWTTAASIAFQVNAASVYPWTGASERDKWRKTEKRRKRVGKE